MADNVRGLVIARGTGFWSLDQVTRHYDELAHMLHAQRTLRGRASLLANISGAAQQVLATRSAIKIGTSSAFARADAVALICPHEGFAQQVKDAAAHPALRLFADETTALGWLAALQGDTGSAAA